VRSAVAAVVSLLLLTSPALAQESPAGFLYVQTAEVKPGMNAEFDDFVKKVQSAARQTQERVVTYQRVLGGSTNTCYFAIQFNDWSDLDGWQTVPQMLVDVYGQSEATTLLAAGAGAMTLISTSASEVVPDFSSGRAAPASNLPAYGQVIRTEVDPGLSAQYEHFLRRLKVAEDQAGVANIRRVSRQGPALTFTTVRLYASHAERDRWATPQQLLTDAFGENEARMLFASQAEAVRTREIYTLWMRPDLSRVPESTNNQ